MLQSILEKIEIREQRSDLTLSFTIEYKVLLTQVKETLPFAHILRIKSHSTLCLFSKAMAQLHDMVRRDSSNISEKKNKFILHLGLFLESMPSHVLFMVQKSVRELFFSSLVWDQREKSPCDICSTTRKKLQKSSTKAFSYEVAQLLCTAKMLTWCG